MTQEYAINSAEAFDTISEVYDETFELNPITKQIRSVVTGRLLTCFQRGQHLIEINCGTGTDAIALASNGIRVTAIDASPKMIDITRAKSVDHGVENMIDARVMDFGKLRELEYEAYDGAFSNFGGLNCTSHLEEVAENIFRILKPGSIFIACVMNSICLWELMSFVARGKFGKAFRRLRQKELDVKLGNSTVRTWYYSPQRFADRMWQWFEVERIYGLNILSPMPNSRTFARKHERLTANLLKFDDLIRDKFPFYALGDHFVVEMRSVVR